jgi:hypothetical protein
MASRRPENWQDCRKREKIRRRCFLLQATVGAAMENLQVWEGLGLN